MNYQIVEDIFERFGIVSGIIIFSFLLFWAAFWALYKISFEKRISGDVKERVEKEINKHALSLGHTFARRMADYEKYVDMKHKVYSTMCEKMTLVQGLLSDKDSMLKNVGIDRIKQWQQESGYRGYENAFEKYLDAPNEEKAKRYETVKKLDGVIRDLILIQIIPEMQQHFYLNKIYFSEELSKKIIPLADEMEALRIVKFTWNDEQRIAQSIELIENLDQWMEDQWREDQKRDPSVCLKKYTSNVDLWVNGKKMGGFC